MSLGVDLVPKKVCSLDCVYCEVGKTTKLTLDCKEYIQLDKIKEELRSYFENNPDPDYITFSGSGEPTLNIHIGEVLQFIKQNKPHIPVALLTNGTLLFDERVKDAVMGVDVLLPSSVTYTALFPQGIFGEGQLWPEKFFHLFPVTQSLLLNLPGYLTPSF